jgi:hypothetical protein
MVCSRVAKRAENEKSREAAPLIGASDNAGAKIGLVNRINFAPQAAQINTPAGLFRNDAAEFRKRISISLRSCAFDFLEIFQGEIARRRRVWYLH